MQNKVVNLVAQGNRQQINNVNSYLGKIEDTAALLFSDELYYEFDATAPALDTFEKLQTEKTIKNRLDDLGILENFSDFGIVYARLAGYRIQRYSYFQMEDYSLILIIISIIQKQDPGVF